MATIHEDSNHICAGIEYMNPDGIPVHSDLCIEGTTPPSIHQRRLLHATLDEWLNLSNGSGIFWIGDPTLLYPDDNQPHGPKYVQPQLFKSEGSNA